MRQECERNNEGPHREVEQEHTEGASVGVGAPTATENTSSPVPNAQSSPAISLVTIPFWVHGRLSTLERLSIAKCNWPEWSRCIPSVLRLCGGSPPLKDYVDGWLPYPDATFFPLDHGNWMQKNSLVIALVDDYVEDADLHLIASSSIARDLWTALQNRHIKQGAYVQLMTIQDLFCDDLDPSNTTFDIENQARRTTAEVTHMFQMGPLSEDTFTVVVLLHKMKAKILPLMNHIMNDQSTSSTPLTADPDRTAGVPPPAIALAATSSHQQSRKGHLADHCWVPGGGAEGQRDQYIARQNTTSAGKPDSSSQFLKAGGDIQCLS
ncbi:hypothetical protein BD309DRAFT_995336 [Dichomitus squalens]|uniref:Uncharacterized protein n=1 Tax=Dichomitus squalens TaxID=114155 RepID=A0A4Q9N8G5_9APHY|nr:hypothetical protein BD309DRAFT_995336 [Dichomitus squalens]TBU51537.1 hypothetical protein BD310DRAFT_953217 [Dichomitus squalens]